LNPISRTVLLLRTVPSPYPYHCTSPRLSLSLAAAAATNAIPPSRHPASPPAIHTGLGTNHRRYSTASQKPAQDPLQLSSIPNPIPHFDLASPSSWKMPRCEGKVKMQEQDQVWFTQSRPELLSLGLSGGVLPTQRSRWLADAVSAFVFGECFFTC
jgi:hypothetical protein